MRYTFSFMLHLLLLFFFLCLFSNSERTESEIVTRNFKGLKKKKRVGWEYFSVFCVKEQVNCLSFSVFVVLLRLLFHSVLWCH